MKRLLAVLMWFLIAAYPVIVLFGLRSLPLSYIASILIAIALLRLWFMRGSSTGRTLPLALTLVLLLTLAYALLSGNTLSLKFYPVAVNAVLLLVFAGSLYSNMPMVERLARLQDPDLPSSAIIYTRKVTWVWCGFFLFNGLAALYTTLYCSFEFWALYNGGIAYGLIGLLFCCEWLVRIRVKRHANAQTH